MSLPAAYGGAGLLPYSEAEQAVPGVTWIDGRQVYQITVDFGALPDTDSKITAHLVADIDYVIGHLAYALDDDTGLTMPLPNVSGTLAALVRFNVDRTNITCVTGSDRTAFETSAVTFWYVKS